VLTREDQRGGRREAPPPSCDGATDSGLPAHWQNASSFVPPIDGLPHRASGWRSPREAEPHGELLERTSQPVVMTASGISLLKKHFVLTQRF
jgi:hypothetical protein